MSEVECIMLLLSSDVEAMSFSSIQALSWAVMARFFFVHYYVNHLLPLYTVNDMALLE
jgi:hypothetical protein